MKERDTYSILEEKEMKKVLDIEMGVIAHLVFATLGAFFIVFVLGGLIGQIVL